MRDAPLRKEEVRELVAQVKAGALSRRGFIGKMVLLGLTAPMASQILSASGVSSVQTTSDYKPVKRGGGGPLKTLFWQGPTLLNPHFAVGTKDQIGSQVFYEPLAVWDPDGAALRALGTSIGGEEGNQKLQAAVDAYSVSRSIASR
jgi:peptide/nickel transport system substrate-binding protein